MKIPDAEMPPVFTIRDLVKGVSEKFDPDSKVVGFGHYQKLYNERRFIPVEECSPWVSVESELPDCDFGIFLAWGPELEEVGVKMLVYGDHRWLWPDEVEPVKFTVTHWMPLPAPPEDK